MATYRDIGIPLKKVEIGEGGLLLNILTQYHGLVNARAPGARKLKSRKRGNFEIGALSKFSLAEGKNIDVVVEAELSEYFENLRASKESSLFVSRIAKLANILFVTADKEAYSLLYSTLKFADAIAVKITAEKWRILEEIIECWFEYSALRWAGLIEPVKGVDISEKYPREGVLAIKDAEVRRKVRQLTIPALADIMGANNIINK